MCGLGRRHLGSMVCPTTSGELMKKARGFTLIELLVVMSILALLLTIALPRYFGSLDRAKVATLKENLLIIRGSLEKFNGDKGRYPQSLQELVEQQYLRDVPMDPVTERRDSWVLVPSAASPGVPTGVFDVHSGAPGATRDGVAYADF